MQPRRIDPSRTGARVHTFNVKFVDIAYSSGTFSPAIGSQSAKNLLPFCQCRLIGHIPNYRLFFPLIGCWCLEGVNLRWFEMRSWVKKSANKKIYILEGPRRVILNARNKWESVCLCVSFNPLRSRIILNATTCKNNVQNKISS